MPSPLRTLSDLQNLLLFASIQIQSLALFLLDGPAFRRTLTVLDNDPTALENELSFTFNDGPTALLVSAGTLAFLAQYLAQSSTLRGPYFQWRKCVEWFPLALMMPDMDFRAEFRLSRRTFDRLVSVLEKNPIFRSTGKKPQRPVRFQLATFLLRYGVLGSGSLQAAHKMGIGFGTVFDYCGRVSTALVELGMKAVVWPDEQRQQETSNYVEGLFRYAGCIGIVDGTLIRLSAFPLLQGFAYYCRKKYPALNIQVIVDHLYRFIAHEMGWPGSVTDVSIWKSSHVWMRRHAHFRDGRFILGDKGYPSSPYLVRTFAEDEIPTNDPQRRSRILQFNQHLSRFRITVEHAIGMLKGRFPSLKVMGPHESMDVMYDAIEAMMVIHNVCINIGDHPSDFFKIPTEGDVGVADVMQDGVDVGGEVIGEDDEDGDMDIPLWETDEGLRREGLALRERLLNHLFPPV